MSSFPEVARPVEVVDLALGENTLPAGRFENATPTSPASPATVTNPYKRKFIGGAEAARQKSRRKIRAAAVKIISPMERQRLNEEIPINMNPMERVAAALLRTSPVDFVASETDSSPQSMEVWSHICKRVGVPVTTEPIRPCYDDSFDHFSIRAALVLEEARAAIAQPLSQRWSEGRNGGSRESWFPVTAHYSEKLKSSRHVRVTFRKATHFSKEELFHIRPGSVFQCLPRDSAMSLNDVVLGFVLSASRESVEQDREFNVIWFRDIPDRIDNTEWVLSPIQTLIQNIRCFEAMTTNHTPPFLFELLGNKRSEHTKFDEDGNPKARKEPGAAEKKMLGAADYSAPKDGPVGKQQNGPFRLPFLNDTQQKAADAFLESSPKTITLIQGPPGTGKTTLLVSIICRYLMQENNSVERKKRLLVCAPTNKAVTVLATRFMEAMDQEKSHFNALMVGDADKLLAEERGNKENYSENQSSLRSIFVFSWLQSVIEDYRKIRNYYMPNARGGDNNRKKASPSSLHKLAVQLERRLQNNLNGLPPEVLQGVSQTCHALKATVDGNGADVVSVVNALLQKLQDILKNEQDFIWRVLVNNAHVLFCTLTSAGGMILKNHRVDDLIVDEAAAATEPELCIPMHLQPSRMLCVGDPRQLPATVISRRAVDLGLAESLHERLMFRCNRDYVMLDVQYRMHPAISCFPSKKFYDSKITNGANVMSPSRVGSASLVDSSPYIFMTVKGIEEQGAGGSYRNYQEATCIVDLILHLRTVASGQNRMWHSASHVRVITFYQAQVTLIQQMLRKYGLHDKIVVATVDSSQGCEADIVLVSFVRSKTNTAGFLTDDRRMNVALTRAKHQMICVGNVDSLSRMQGAGTLRALAQDAIERDAVHSLAARKGNTYRPNNPARQVQNRLDAFSGP